MTRQLAFGISVLITVLLFAGCDCKKECPAFSGSLDIMPGVVGDELRFTNDNGAAISFRIVSKNTSIAYTKRDSRQTDGCPTMYCDAGTARITATSATSRSGSNSYSIGLTDGYNGECQLQLLDFNTTFKYNPALSGGARDIVAATLVLGGHQYSNVLITSADTVANPAQSVWQVYLSATGGVLGFRDRQTRSLFYRQ